jgi:acyl carrier protein
MLKEEVVELIQDSLNSLQRTGLIEQSIVVQDETVLLGTGSPLDSVAFVTLITDLEDRLTRETGQDIFLILGDIHDFNMSEFSLNVKVLAQYIVNLTRR